MNVINDEVKAVVHEINSNPSVIRKTCRNIHKRVQLCVEPFWLRSLYYSFMKYAKKFRKFVLLLVIMMLSFRGSTKLKIICLNFTDYEMKTVAT